MTEAAQRKKKKIWESSERYASHSIIRLSFVPNRVFLGVFQQYFSYIMEISFIDGGNLSTWRISKTCCKSLTNSIKQCCIEYTSQWTGFELTTLVVIGTDCMPQVVVNPTTIRSQPWWPPIPYTCTMYM